MNCPRKCGGELRKVLLPELNDAEIYLCTDCEGTWYPSGALTAVGQSPLSAIETSQLSVSLVADKLEKIDLEADVDCPVCQQKMTRFSYSLAPEVKIDECLDHGTWLDDGELGTIINSIAETQSDIREYRQKIQEKRKEMNIDGVARGGSNPFALTIRVLNALFSSGKA
jgi:Zn-finger nucleic acid-binding protein